MSFVRSAMHNAACISRAHPSRLFSPNFRSLATVSDQHFRVPVIDFAPFWSDSEGMKKEVARQVVDAFKNIGFMYIKNHGVDEVFVQEVFHESDKFFALPQAVKDELAWKDPRANRGYVKQGRERVTDSTDPEVIKKLRETSPDVKESMEIGLETDPAWKNHWPSTGVAPDFRSTMLKFYDTCHTLHLDVLRSIAMGLGLNERFFDPLADQKCHTLRLLNYPPVSRKLLEKEGQARAGAHSDYGSITFVFQDDVGGLQVQNPHTKNFISATPIPGTIVVNVGDLLARWSNDIFRSTLHRVVSPTRSDAASGFTPRRQSIAFFCNPNWTTMVECLPGCEGLNGPKYPKVLTEDYLVQRLSQTYD
ncbi:Clavaminate synthase-like protein [Cantharellus anzutake]|uniref:Clavaminate synthase-like protein n=1 Tax=Cantharellus anzutake TaxID=1750568 RepID=UPI00190407E1|nr:Clavaminate synthase-like protein [Cantharellus anzutake]KAF8325168.1 Clavaminate synthase-like protein [Cantharellus anzutake]